MKTARSFHAAAVYGSKLYVVGGRDAGRTTLETYDLITGVWSMSPCGMGQARRCHAAVVHNKKLYVVGGRANHTTLASVEVYNFASGQWSILHTEMSTPRSGARPAQWMLPSALDLVMPRPM
jgi:N-acetylneuraminic acid mutarotase